MAGCSHAPGERRVRGSGTRRRNRAGLKPRAEKREGWLDDELGRVETFESSCDRTACPIGGGRGAGRVRYAARMRCEPSDAFHALVSERPPFERDPEVPGVHFYRATERAAFAIPSMPGPFVSIIAQGRKVARFGGLELEYAPCHYLVVLGDGPMEGQVVEASPATPYLSVSVDLPHDVIAKTLIALADEKAELSGVPAPAFVAPAERALKDTVARYVQACADPLERRMIAPLVLEELVFRLLRTDAAAVLRAAVGREPDADAIQHAMRFMRERATRPLSVADVARHVGMSPSHFAHRFRAVAQTSPMRYLKQLRMQEARARLLSDGARIAEVAAHVGYESPSHFTRDFKHHYGATPADYVRRLRAGSGERTAVPDIVESVPQN